MAEYDQITYHISFLFEDGLEHPLLKLAVYYSGEELNLSLSELSMFLYQNEDNLEPEDVDFCLCIGKVLKKIKKGDSFIIAVPHLSDMVSFFERAIEYKRQLIWDFQGESVPVVFERKAPFTIRVTGNSGNLTLELGNRGLHTFSPLRWFPMHTDKKSYVFSNGVVIANPPADFSTFMLEVFSKKEIRFVGDEVKLFFSNVLEPFKQLLTWDLPKNINDYRPKEVLPKPVLNLTYENGCLTPLLSFKYADVLVEPSDKDDFVQDKRRNKTYKRNLELEQKAQMDLIQAFERLDLPLLLDNPGVIAAFMGTLVPQLVDRGWKVNANVPEFKVLEDPVSLEFGINQTSNDWFYFEPSGEILGEKISLQEIARLMVDDGGYIKTKQGYVRLHEDSEKELKMLAEMGAFKVNSKFDKAEIVPLISLAKVKGSGQEAASIINQVKHFHKESYCDVSKTFKGELRNYQQYGVNWINFLYRTGFGGILADDMGLGKTIQVIAFLSQITREAPALVVAPTNVLFNWEKEIKKFSPQFSTLVYTGGSRKSKQDDLGLYDVVISSFGVIKNDLDILKQQTFDVIVVDEAQYIKNPKAQITQALKGLNSTFRLALTGTPIENRLEDIWSLFDFVMPDYLENQRLFDIALKDGKRNQVKAKIKPFILRREKREVLDSLPDKTEINLTCPLTDEQMKLYKTVLDTAKKGLRSSTGKVERMNVLKALLKLRQICITPSLLSEFKGQFQESSKLDVLKSRIPELLDEDHKVVCFTQFTGVLDLIQNWLESESIYFERIDGSVTAKKRLEAVDRFQASEKPGVFIISLKAGGVGLNLTAADYVFMLDPWWNPAIEAQATDRVHRMGQTSKVFVYRLIAQGTIEEKIQELQQEKRELLTEIVDIDSAEEKQINFDEIKNLVLG